MAIDTTAHWFQLLLRQFEQGNVVLFAGAGFSLDAKNRGGNDPPAGRELAAILAERCGWSYDNEDLSVVYAQAQLHLGTGALNDMLAELYQDCTPSNWHRLVTQCSRSHV